MDKLIIKEKDYQSIVAFCLKEKPNEACGILAGIIDKGERKVKKVYLMKNIKKSPEEYLMDPKEQFKVFADLRENNLELISIFHSHPHSLARPSKKDIKMAYYPEAFYTIISLEKKEEDFKSFIIKDNNYQGIKIIVEEN